jgi:hypothetical protein
MGRACAALHHVRCGAAHVVVGCPTSTFVPLRRRRSQYWALGSPHQCGGLPYLGTCLPSSPCCCVRCWDGLPYLGIRDFSSSSCRVHQRWAAHVVVGYPTSVFASLQFRRVVYFGVGLLFAVLLGPAIVIWPCVVGWLTTLSFGRILLL